METLARELKHEINIICIEYYYLKEINVIEKSRKLLDKIQEFTKGFLQGNIYGMEEEEYQMLQNFVLQCLDDYIEAVGQQDMVRMVDTLDYGLRELINIYIDPDTMEETNEEYYVG